MGVQINLPSNHFFLTILRGIHYRFRQIICDICHIGSIIIIHLLNDYFYNSTLYKNAGFSLDKNYAIFPQILLFSPIFPSPRYFFPAILSAVVFFRNTTAGGKIPCLKIERD